jgi:hypothetical protein
MDLKKKFTGEQIKNIFEQNICRSLGYSFEQFYASLIELSDREKAEEKTRKDEKKRRININENNIYPDLDNDTYGGDTYEERIKSIVDEEDDYFKDKLYGCDIPDDGSDFDEYLKIGGKVFLVDIHCKADWCGDWSVRANLPGELSVTGIKEIEYELIEEFENEIIIKRLN